MKYAIFGDIHANLEAFDAVLEDAETQGIDSYICLGDIVGYNADPGACLAKVRELDAIVVRGNHDHYVCHDETLYDLNPVAARVVEWTRDQLSDAERTFLKTMRMVRAVEGFTIVHSTLDTPERWGYVFEEVEADASFNYQTTAVCFHGHTHVPVAYEKSSGIKKFSYKQFQVTLGRKYFINAGSVGQPRDGDPRAAYVTYDTKSKDVELRRVSYDIAAAQEKILSADLPRALAARLAVGR